MWYYKDKEFLYPNPIYKSFVYCITNKLTGKKYIGKKQFTFSKTKQIKGKKKKSLIDSDWMDYYGSNKELAEDVLKNGKENFHREILHLCKTKGTASYWETYEIMINHAILSENYYNGWFTAKVSRSHVKE